MDVSMERIERITGERLRQLPLNEDDIYNLDRIEHLEDDDEITAAEAGFMRGYLQDD